MPSNLKVVLIANAKATNKQDEWMIGEWLSAQRIRPVHFWRSKERRFCIEAETIKHRRMEMLRLEIKKGKKAVPEPEQTCIM